MVPLHGSIMSSEIQPRQSADGVTTESTQGRLSLEGMNALATKAVARNGGYVDGIEDFLAIMHGAQSIADIQIDPVLAEWYEELRTMASDALEAIVLRHPAQSELAVYAQAAGHYEAVAQTPGDPLSQLAYRIGRSPNTDEWIGQVELPVFRYFQSRDADAYIGLQAGTESDAVHNGIITLRSFRRSQDASEVDVRPIDSPREKTTIRSWDIGKDEILENDAASNSPEVLAVLEEMLTAVVAIRASRGL